MANETTENELNETGEPGTEYFMETLPGQDRYVAPLDETPLQDVDSVDESAPATSMWADAWRTLRKNPLFIISGLLIIFIVFVALFPSVLTKQNPNYCTLDNSLEPASSGHPFGFDLQGCDVYSRVVYGTRTSLSVGVFATLLVVLLGTLIGAIAGFFGGWVDAVLSRLTDIFLALPILLGAIVVLQMFKTSSSIWKIILVMTLFGWTSVARIARGAVMEAKNLEFNTASTALGSPPIRNLFRHILPNVVSLLIVSMTLDFATCMLTESTLSYLGFGIPLPTPTWGNLLNGANNSIVIQQYWWQWVFPAVIFGICTICINLIGDGLRDALDPKALER
mgnify:CR=1 FL=1